MKRNRKILLAAFLIAGGIAAFPFVWRAALQWRYSNQIHTLEAAPAGEVAIVFGARVYSNGRLSAMLRDRVDAAVNLYQAGKIQKIIMSGDNRTDDYNEPGWMMAYAIERGIPAEDIQPDYAGLRTYDTCYRAREIFQLQEAVLITQKFHLPRAMFLCDSMGLRVTGVIADRQPYTRRSLFWSTAREFPAMLAALFDAVLQRPAPILGEPIPFG